NFVNLASFTNRTITFADYQMSSILLVPLASDDTTTNASATVTFTLTNPKVVTGEDPAFTPIIGGAKTLTLTIIDNDDPFKFSFSTLNPVVSEGSTLTMNVTLGASPGATMSPDTVS